MSAVATGLPDLLQRFVPTPYSAEWRFSECEIALQSNDQALITSLERAGTYLIEAPLPWSLGSFVIMQRRQAVQTLPSSRRGRWPRIMVGTGTVLAVDWSAARCLGFIASSVSADAVYSTRYFPSLLKLASRRSGTTTRDAIAL